MTETEKTSALPAGAVPVKLEAPVVLTPDQIQQIAAGTMLLNKATLMPVTRMGLWVALQKPTISLPVSAIS